MNRFAWMARLAITVLVAVILVHSASNAAQRSGGLGIDCELPQHLAGPKPKVITEEMIASGLRAREIEYSSYDRLEMEFGCAFTDFEYVESKPVLYLVGDIDGAAPRAEKVLGETGKVQVRGSAFNAAELRRAKYAAMDVIAKHAPGGTSIVSYTARGVAIELDNSDLDLPALRTRLAGAVGPKVPLDVKLGSTLRPAHGWAGEDGVLHPGLKRVVQPNPPTVNYCTTGPVIVDSWNTKWGTLAGHCGPVGMPVNSMCCGAPSGSVAGNLYWGLPPGSHTNADIGYFSWSHGFNASMWHNPSLHLSTGYDGEAYGPPNGTSVCHLGRTSKPDGFATCGTSANRDSSFQVGTTWIDHGWASLDSSGGSCIPGDSGGIALKAATPGNVGKVLGSVSGYGSGRCFYNGMYGLLYNWAYGVFVNA